MPETDFAQPPGLPPDPRGAVITVGTFDGVHRGHLAVLGELRRQARHAGRRSVLVTFHPHPLRIVRPEAAPPLLTTPDEKKEILAETGIDYAVFIDFTPALSRYSPRRFVEDVLVRRLGLRHLVIGHDHGFGHGRSGDVNTLRAIGADLDIRVDVVEAVPLNGGPVSSSRIRRALQAGDLYSATAALGRPYSVHGTVVRGDGRGRQLGFPTANLRIGDADKLLPLEGVYAVRALIRGRLDREFGDVPGLPGVLHLGPRPTFQGSPPSVELHLFDFADDLYGEEIRVDFCGRIRGIHRFRFVDELIEAIRADCTAARRLFASGGGACHGAITVVH